MAGLFRLTKANTNVDSPNAPREEMTAAKQTPRGKAIRALAADGRMYFSYAQIAETVSRAVPAIRAFAPDVIVAIGGGGFIPARMLRTEVRVPILAVSLELYDDSTKSANARVLKKQWFDPHSGVGTLVKGGRVLVIDEVDDTRMTLQFCCAELLAHEPAALATFVVHDKDKPKKGSLPPTVTQIAGEHVPDFWACCTTLARSHAACAPAHGSRVHAPPQIPGTLLRMATPSASTRHSLGAVRWR